MKHDTISQLLIEGGVSINDQELHKDKPVAPFLGPASAKEDLSMVGCPQPIGNVIGDGSYQLSNGSGSGEPF